MISPYRTAIDQTTNTIDRRAKHFRNLIVAVTCICLGSLLWAGITISWHPFTGMILLLPACGIYLLYDGRELNHWRHQLFKKWIKQEIDFRALCDAVSSITTLPKDSMQSMLETLPLDSDLVSEQDISMSTRQAIAAVVNTINICRFDAIAWKTSVYTLTAGVIVITVASWQWQPLLSLIIVGLLIFMQKLVKIKRLKNARDRIHSVRREPDFSFEKYMNIINKIRWMPISDTEKNIFLAKPSQDI
jgi:hypothetical protein